jgi:hypothetical protein
VIAKASSLRRAHIRIWLPTADDPYDDEAYRLWAIEQQGK